MMRTLLVRDFLSPQAYETTWQAMRTFVDAKGDQPDELWLLTHAPVYTLGQAGKPAHILQPGSIPVVKTDRGGQVTYHGPGQLVAYCLFDLNRLGIGVKSLVCGLEQALLALLAEYAVSGHLKAGAPGVYVADQKIASLGLRLRRGVSYHGLSLNVAMDLTPFLGINPCGFAGMQMTQLRDFVPEITLAAAKQILINTIADAFAYERIISCGPNS